MLKKLVLAAVATLAISGPALADPIYGTWQTIPDDNGNYGHISVGACSNDTAKVCGQLVRSFDSAGKQFTSANQGRAIIWDTENRGNGEYRGRVYSPEREAEYASKRILNGNSLSVSGCRMGFCREGGVWSRVN